MAGAPPSGVSAPILANPDLKGVALHNGVLSWQWMLSHLANYKEQYGSTNVPEGFPILGPWVRNLREQYELQGTNSPSIAPLDPKLIASLDALGFQWRVEEEGNESDNAQAWEERFRALCKFKESMGHTMVPARYPEDRQLGHWVMTQRRQYHLLKKGRPSSMTTERVKKLNSLAFVWSVRTDHDEMWSVRFEELKAFKAKYGDCLVPQRYPPNPQLGTWVNTQRRHYRLMKDGKHSSMTEDRVQALEDIGFTWVTSRGAPSLKKRSGKEGVAETASKKQKLDAYEILQRRFPDGETASSQGSSILCGAVGGKSTQEALGGMPVVKMEAQRDAQPASGDSVGKTSAASEPARRKQKSKWLCDRCRTATFDSFEEAHAHESKCQG